MGKQESMEDWFQTAKDYARAEKELKIERWVYISIEYKEEGKLEYVRLFTYDFPRDVYERRKWVIRWRISRLQCQYPKQFVQCYFSYYDKRLGTDIRMNEDLYRLISAKAQVTKAERKMREYIEYNRQNNMFFNEETDDDLVKFRDKLERKIANVAECEKRLKELVERRRKNYETNT